MNEDLDNPSAKLLAAIRDLPEASTEKNRVSSSDGPVMALMLQFLSFPPVPLAKLLSPPGSEPDEFLLSHMQTAPSLPTTPVKAALANSGQSSADGLTMADKELLQEDSLMPCWKPPGSAENEWDGTIESMINYMQLTLVTSNSVGTGLSLLLHFKAKLIMLRDEIVRRGVLAMETNFGPGSAVKFEATATIPLIVAPDAEVKLALTGGNGWAGPPQNDFLDLYLMVDCLWFDFQAHSFEHSNNSPQDRMHNNRVIDAALLLEFITLFNRTAMYYLRTVNHQNFLFA